MRLHWQRGSYNDAHLNTRADRGQRVHLEHGLAIDSRGLLYYDGRAGLTLRSGQSGGCCWFRLRKQLKWNVWMYISVIFVCPLPEILMGKKWPDFKVQYIFSQKKLQFWEYVDFSSFNDTKQTTDLLTGEQKTLGLNSLALGLRVDFLTLLKSA